jgi:23S rRNA (guanosine2251-2'-O)-methyltransferase
MPVLEALLDPRAPAITRLVLARRAEGDAVDRIVAAAARRGVRLERADPDRVTRLSGNGRHDQGVVAVVAAPGQSELDGWLAAHGGPLALLLLDGLTNPANVGMIIRTAAAAGLDGVVLPRSGSPELGPLVVKTSAGVALWATVLGSPEPAAAASTLAAAGVAVIGLSGARGEPLWGLDVPPRAAFVLGNETTGVSPGVGELVDRWCAVPLQGGVESLNVAAAAAVVAFELARRRRDPGVNRS